MSIPLYRRLKPFLAASTLALCGLALGAHAGGPSKEKMAELKQLMQQQIMMMKPELQQRVKALSPETKKLLLGIYGQHTIHSKQATLRQVMHEANADYQSMVVGVVTDNSEQAASAALRLANHRIPVGGLLPYLDLKFINDASLSALASFNDAVEGNAKRLAAAANEGDITGAAAYVGDITKGCVGCHSIFRGVPGRSSLLR